ncbi:MAG: hypothetical protein E6R04_01130 [Spirochaetes bacterium]|nr:MAG: hypothetical protein E6R04_01130 [Spirochaetota bacterium]
MSYEGYSQCICVNGHFTNISESYGERLKCPVCSRTKFAWVNEVDETNCDSYGYVDPETVFSMLGKMGENNVCRLPTEDDIRFLNSMRSFRYLDKWHSVKS